MYKSAHCERAYQCVSPAYKDTNNPPEYSLQYKLTSSFPYLPFEKLYIALLLNFLLTHFITIEFFLPIQVIFKQETCHWR